MDRRFLLMSGTMLLLTACSSMRETAGPPGAGYEHAPAFAASLSESDAYEVAAGQAALRRASNPQVRMFAQEMIDTHTRSSGDLNAVLTASAVKVRLRDRPTGAARGRIARLAAGAGFDKAYLTQQVEAHEAAVNLVRGYIDSGDKGQVHSFAVTLLPTVQMHLEKARSLAANLL